MIFISYSWRDHPTVKVIESFLIHNSAEYWIDRKNLDLSGCIKSQIKFALQQSDCVLHLASESSRSSPWVRYETKTATMLGKEILELDLEDNSFKPNNTLHSDKLFAALLIRR